MKIEGLITAADDDYHEVSNIKPEAPDEKPTKPKVATQDIAVFGSDEMVRGGGVTRRKSRPETRVAVTVDDNLAAEETIQKNLVKEDGGYRCKICDFIKKKKTDLTRHIETHIEGLSYSCSVCHKTFRSRNSLPVYHKF